MRRANNELTRRDGFLSPSAIASGAPGQLYCPGCEATMHPSREVLSALASEKLAAADRAAVLTHVAQCDSCREFLALIAPEEGPPTAVVRTTTKK